MRHFVFVYGTLKRGYGNHGLLQNHGSTYCGTVLTEPAYLLYASGGGTGIPFMVAATPPKGISIRGEVYLVDDATLASLDQLEGHPDFYVRTEIKLLKAVKFVDPVFSYLLPPERLGYMKNLVSCGMVWDPRKRQVS